MHLTLFKIYVRIKFSIKILQRRGPIQCQLHVFTFLYFVCNLGIFVSPELCLRAVTDDL